MQRLPTLATLQQSAQEVRRFHAPVRPITAILEPHLGEVKGRLVDDGVDRLGDPLLAISPLVGCVGWPLASYEALTGVLFDEAL